MEVEEKLGKFVKLSEEIRFEDEEGNQMEVITAGRTVVHGPFRLVTKDQIARVYGIVTPSMLNSKNDKGEQVYCFQGNGWRPEAKTGDILLQDTENPDDRWACGPELFGGTGWTGTVNKDGSVTYAKPGRPLPALELPEGTIVESREGARATPKGALLAFSNPNKGDFYIWTPDVVQSYVRDYPKN